MIVCDRAYLQSLKCRMEEARELLPKEVAVGIDAEIESVEALGDPWYSLQVVAMAFRTVRMAGRVRDNPRRPKTKQGDLPKWGDLFYGTWFDACAVNKDTRLYRTWVNPNDAIDALQISHRINRYEHTSSYNGQPNGQTRIDKRRSHSDHRNETVQ